MEIRKKVDQCIDELGILDYKGPAYLKNISHKIDDVACDMETRNNNITFSFNEYFDFPREPKAISSVVISLDNKTLYTDDLFLRQYPSPLIFTTSKVYTNIIDKSDSYFIRMMFKIDDSFRLDMYISDCKPSYIENMGYAFNLIQINTGEKFDLYVFQYNDENYLVLECQEKMTSIEFRKNAHAIMVSLGFITGSFINSNRFIFYSNDQYFSKIENVDIVMQKKSIKNQFSPINSHVYGYKYFLDTKEFNSLLASSKNSKFLMTTDELAKLSNLSLNNVEILGSILMILEGNSCSLDTMSCTLCVVLEALSGFISKEDEGKRCPIQNKTIWNKLRHDLCAQLDNDYLHDESGVSIIRNRIKSNLNTPANADKLTKPFDLLEITLLSDDIDAIKQRNYALHGTFEKIDGVEMKNDPKIKELIKKCLKLNFLVSALLLRLCDFCGWIPTYAQYYENKASLTSDSLFRFVGKENKSTSG